MNERSSSSVGVNAASNQAPCPSCAQLAPLYAPSMLPARRRAFSFLFGARALKLAGCRHALCRDCWQQLFDRELRDHPGQFAQGALVCPAAGCKKTLPLDFVLRVASESTVTAFKHLLSTVPRTLHPRTLADFNYVINDRGELVHRLTGERFRFITQRHYDALGDAMIDHIQNLMEVWLPVSGVATAGSSTGTQPADRTNRTASASSVAPLTLTHAHEAIAVIAGTQQPGPGSAVMAVDPIAEAADDQDTSESGRRPKSARLSISALAGPHLPALEGHCNIFLSPDALSNISRLMVIIQGSGPVRPGMWARALCLNNNLDLGSIFPYLLRARAEGYGVIVLNPNMNTGPSKPRSHAPAAGTLPDSADDKTPEPDISRMGTGSHQRKISEVELDPDEVNHMDSEDSVSEAPVPVLLAGALDYLLEDRRTPEAKEALTYFLDPDKRPRDPEEPEYPVPGNETPAKHTVYVWDHFIRYAAARDIVIVAHSAGGPCTLHLLKRREAEVLPRVRAIAFTDSVHSISPDDPPVVRAFIRQHVVNYVTSDKPLDTPVRVSSTDSQEAFRRLGVDMDAMTGCPCVSAGHTQHAFTSGTAIESVFRFFDRKLSGTRAPLILGGGPVNEASGSSLHSPDHEAHSTASTEAQTERSVSVVGRPSLSPPGTPSAGSSPPRTPSGQPSSS